VVISTENVGKSRVVKFKRNLYDVERERKESKRNIKAGLDVCGKMSYFLSLIVSCTLLRFSDVPSLVWGSLGYPDRYFRFHFLFAAVLVSPSPCVPVDVTILLFIRAFILSYHNWGE
jgi:hypothetical protein